MKKTVLSLMLLAGLTASPTWAAQENEPAVEAVMEEKTIDPVAQFTGKYWMESTLTNKEAYLFGIESAIAVNYQIEKKLAEQPRKSRKAANVLSKFDKGWIEAFQSTPRKDIVAAVDKWYADHPESLKRPVLNTIWYELILPRLNQAK